MEIVLQWLDEIDDLVFAGFAFWLRLRRLCLAIALAAAVSMLAWPGRLESIVPIALLGLAAVTLLAWMAVAAISLGADRSAQSVTDRA